MTKRALVISGGGSKGAFAVGVLQYLASHFPQITFDTYVGTSTGSLITPLAAIGKINLLQTLYTTVTTNNIITKGNVVNRLLSKENSLYDASPLANLITKYYDDNNANAILNSPKELFLATACLQTDNLVYFSSKPKSSTPDYDVIKINTPDEMRRAIIASSCQPVFMPPIEVQKGKQPIRQYVDGGLRELAGVQVAIDAGATEIYAIILSPESNSVDNTPYTDAFAILQKTIDVLTTDVGYNDISIPLLYNKALGYINEVQQKMKASGIPQQAIDGFFSSALPNPFAEKKPLNIYIIRPNAPLGGGPGGLNFDPAEMQKMLAAGAKKGEEFIAAKQWAVLGAGAVGALAYTFSDSFWFSAVEGEVYAMSSFFTAFVFWAMLKWDEEDDTNPVGSMRWLVVISYLMGLSIGVHLLNLLVIPAICYAYYFKKHKFTWKSFFITGAISLVLLGGIQAVMIPKIVKFAADFEIFFVNGLNFGFNIGSAVYFIMLFASLTALIMFTVSKKESHYKIGFYIAIAFTAIVVISGYGIFGKFSRLVVLGGLLYGIHKLKTKDSNTLNVILMSFATLLIGYSSFFIIIIRSQANTPMDENDPENAITMLSYLNREQYGAAPLTYGQYYNAPTKSQQYFKDGEPIYAKDEKSKKYKIIDDKKKSEAVYEEDFCTVFPRMWSSQANHEASYRYWGDVQSHHKTKTRMNEQSGEMEEIQIPTMYSNLTYFFKYQVSYMYLRYFAWNFIGRQNDIQGLNSNPLEGNWKTGIKPIDNVLLDTDTSFVPHAASDNKGSNSFYALPFILGILGFAFQYKRDKGDTWLVSILFLITGLAIVVYLNQYPYQPRERDYAYAASFYAFAIWIGFGVLFIFDALSKKSGFKTGFAVLATVIGLIIPTIMAAEGWDDHNRTKRTMSRDFAVNYLNSCAPNAIIFTNGDNDTFPLWYAQEVEGVRTDVRVVNLSLLQTDWYIGQARRAAYESAPVPFTIDADKLSQGKREVVYIMDKGTGPMNLKKAIEFVASDDIANKMDYGSKPIDYIPAKSFYVPVDSASVMREKVIAVKDTNRLVKSIKWTIGRNYVLKNDLMVLDLIAHNNWKRPIYFAVTTGSEAYLGLEEYFQLEGLAYRLTPIKNTESEMNMGGRVNTDVMYDNIMNKFLWGGLDKEGVNLDENCTRMASNMRMQMATLASALIAKGQKQKAEKVLDLCLEKMPDANVRFEATLYTIVADYYQIGNMKKATELSSKLFDIYEHDYQVYRAQKPSHRAAFNREMGQAKEIMRRLVMLAEQFKQDAHSKELMKRITATIPAEELMPEDEQRQQAQPIQQ